MALRCLFILALTSGYLMTLGLASKLPVSHTHTGELARAKRSASSVNNMVYFIHTGITIKQPQYSLYNRAKRAILGDEEDNPKPEIKELVVHSSINSRFGEVTIKSVIFNPSEDDNECRFEVMLPDEAFMSNFTMIIDGLFYETEIVSKEEAEKRYEEAKNENKTAGKVSQEPPRPMERVRGMELFQIAMNVAGNSSIEFTLTYMELIKRTRGLYRQEISVRPNQIVNLIDISVNVYEEQGITEWQIFEPIVGNSLEMSNTEVYESFDGSVMTGIQASYKPGVDVQRTMSTEEISGLHGNLVIEYDVNHDETLIQTDNKFYVQFFSPNTFEEVLPKNIIFVIDISGSMGGTKIDKAREAMLVMLDRLHEDDRFMLLLFDDRQKYWPEKEPHLATVNEANIKSAKSFVEKNVHATGGTDINAALVSAAERFVDYKKGSNMIFFLTDGDPTSGVTDTKLIQENVLTATRGQVSIFSLGFGFAMNFKFLATISARNNGFALRILDNVGADVQLQLFFEEIGSPLLYDIKVVVPTGLFGAMTQTTFPQYFEGSEIVFAGELATDVKQVHYSIECTTGDLPIDIPVNVTLDNIIQRPRDPYHPSTVERLYVYMRIKDLLRQELLTDDEEKIAEVREVALQLALQYHLVTPLTSFFIVQQEDQGALIEEEDFMGKASPAGHPVNYVPVSYVPMMDTSGLSSAPANTIAPALILSVLSLKLL